MNQTVQWRKSSHSGQSGNCLEASTVPGAVLIRDSRHPDGARLALPPHAWRDFIGDLKRRSIEGGQITEASQASI